MENNNVSRRSFLKKAAILSTAAGVSPAALTITPEPGNTAADKAANGDGIRIYDHTGVANAVINNHKLVFKSEAKHYYEAAPVGNGRLGAMMFGALVNERIVLNESSMWSGGPQDANRPEAYKVLPEIQQLLLDGKFKDATDLFYKNFNCKGPGSGEAQGADLAFGCYQLLGNLNVFFGQAIPGVGQSENISGYIRELDFATGISSVSYKNWDGSTLSRECIASRPYECIAIRYGCDKPNINFNAQLSRNERFTVKPYGNDGLSMVGQLNNGTDGKGIKYACIVKVKTVGGEVYVQDNTLSVRKATEAVLYITMATDMKNPIGGRQSADALKAAEQDMKKAFELGWDTIREDSVKAHSELYNRSTLKLDGGDIKRTTPERLRSLDKGSRDKGLYELLYHYSRYLLIASNRPGGIPANLQGIWGDEIQTPWNGDWHLDAQQMNFWAAETTGLSELHDPYLKLIYSLMEPGSKTAKAYYNARGWVAHVFTNIWGYTSPGEGADWGATTTGSAWLCQHVWDHYLFTDDLEYLKWAYPILKGCSLFYVDMLVRDPKSSYLVTAPANSPENSFVANGIAASLCVGPAYDNQLLRYVFRATILAAELLGVDADLAAELRKKRLLLAPTRISQRTGGIMEWIEDYEEYKPYHRHTSHLWGAYPGDEITPKDTPELAGAVKRSLVRRGITSPGWANIHRVGILARIADGDAAEDILRFHLQHATYPNLFCRTYHNDERRRLTDMPAPDNYSFPFQIDANLGVGGCIAEMFLQSHRFSGEFKDRVHELQLLPALPSAWDAGSITGLHARGGFVVDIEWKSNTPFRAVIRSIGGRRADVSFMGHTVSIQLEPGQSVTLNSTLEIV
jgi:alpha-L-fucosidase 2